MMEKDVTAVARHRNTRPPGTEGFLCAGTHR